MALFGRKVTKVEFENYVKEYEKKHNIKLKEDVCSLVAPSITTFNDFELGQWPKSVVAWFKVNAHGNLYHIESHLSTIRQILKG